MIRLPSTRVLVVPSCPRRYWRTLPNSRENAATPSSMSGGCTMTEDSLSSCPTSSVRGAPGNPANWGRYMANYREMLANGQVIFTRGFSAMCSLPCKADILITKKAHAWGNFSVLYYVFFRVVLPVAHVYILLTFFFILKKIFTFICTLFWTSKHIFCIVQCFSYLFAAQKYNFPLKKRLREEQSIVLFISCITCRWCVLKFNPVNTTYWYFHELHNFARMGLKDIKSICFQFKKQTNVNIAVVGIN